MMFSKGSDIIAEYESTTDYSSLGEISLTEMGNLPFYVVEHGRKHLEISDWDKLFSMAEL
jgi:hypothetical protein